MNRPPKSVLVAGTLFLASAAYGLITGTLGLELYAFHASRPLVLIMALIHVYLGLGLWAGDGFARGVALWTLGAGFFGSFLDMFWVANAGEANVSSIAPHVVNVFVVSFFLWHLSGSQAIEYAGGGHGDHGHGEHAH